MGNDKFKLSIYGDWEKYENLIMILYFKTYLEMDIAHKIILDCYHMPKIIKLEGYVDNEWVEIEQ